MVKEHGLSFEDHTRHIISIQGCSMITGKAMIEIFGRYDLFKEAFVGYNIEQIPYMDAYLIRKEE